VGRAPTRWFAKSPMCLRAKVSHSPECRLVRAEFAGDRINPATVIWTEALDGGEMKNKVPFRDKVMSLTAPFAGARRSLPKQSGVLRLSALRKKASP